jgi:hypothetical protein
LRRWKEGQKIQAPILRLYLWTGQDEIEKAEAPPSFDREHKYLGLMENVFHLKDIDAATQRGRKNDPNLIVVPYLPYIYGAITSTTISIAPLFLTLFGTRPPKPIYPRWLSPSSCIVHTKPDGTGYVKSHLRSASASSRLDGNSCSSITMSK